MKRWRWALASKIGTSHLRSGTRKQDAAKCTVISTNGTAMLCAIVCDGAGSAEYGGEGASLACRILTQYAKQYFLEHLELPQQDEIWNWVDTLRDVLAVAAEKRAVRRRSFASTLVMLLAVDERIIVVHTGDGSIVARSCKEGAWPVLSWPENGEYASTTYFLTDDPKPKIRICELENEYDAFVLFSDGLEDIALEQATKTAYAPFFSKMISSLDVSAISGKDEVLSAALDKFLESQRVCERTDDDKSMILLSLS